MSGLHERTASQADPARAAGPAPRADPLAAGDAVPEGDPVPATDPDPLAGVGSPGFLARGRIRRRVRYLRRLREVELRDLGGFLVELQRLGRDRPDLIRAKVASALRTDGELRALERSLGSDQPVREIREAGIGGACDRCGAVHGSADNFCAACGEPLIARTRTANPPGADGGAAR